MRKCELLSPAGNMEMLRYAVSYGADAVYLAGTKYGARKFADNFDEKELVEAIEYAHLYGVKVYITLNTLIYENEIDDFVEYVKFIHSIGVDAVLVQDFGMLSLIREFAPNLEIHASTQMHNNSKEMVELLKSKGVTRVVLDREMSLREIKDLPSDIEKEVFVHGALCVSYSGQCLFSSLVLNRSGNRGACAGMCRLPYKLKNDSKDRYYLSLKDLCTANFLDKIIASGVDSLKIEGRMKSPEYVGYMTKIYRRQIDSYYEGTFQELSREEMNNIAMLFNRGFTEGYINDTENDDMVNRETPNHIGIHLGTYTVQKDNIKIFLDEDLHQNDAIRFAEEKKGMTVNFLYNKNGKLVKSGCKGETLYLDNFLELTSSGELRKVGNFLLNESIKNLPTRKVLIDGKIVIKTDKNINFEITDGVNVMTIESQPPCLAKTVPMKEEDIRKQLLKTGSTIYSFNHLDIELDDGLFINIKDLNSLRRNALEKLDEIRKHSKKEVIIKEIEKDKSNNSMNYKKTLTVVVETFEQYKIAKKYTDEIFTTNHKLLKLLKGAICPKYEEQTKPMNSNKFIIGDLGSSINIKPNDVVHSDYMLNVTNSYTARELSKLNIQKICLSPELTRYNLEALTKNMNSNALEILIYGRIELMKMKFDPTRKLNSDILIDRNRKKYPLKKTDKFTYLLSFEAQNKIDEIPKYLEMNIANYRVDFYDESAETCKKILENIHKKLFQE